MACSPFEKNELIINKHVRCKQLTPQTQPIYIVMFDDYNIGCSPMLFSYRLQWSQLYGTTGSFHSSKLLRYGEYL